MGILLKLISGGQTGVDRAALDVGLKLSLEIGGWCPQGRIAEDGIIPSCYPLKELDGGSYDERTRQNVIDSDGTLIIFFGLLSGGTRLTQACCSELKKPCLLLDLKRTNCALAVETLRQFLTLHKISTLNVAGPRASEEQRAYAYTTDILLQLFDTAG